MEPGARSLFKAINCFLKFANMMRQMRMNKPMRFVNINFLTKNAMKKGILDV